MAIRELKHLTLIAAAEERLGLVTALSKLGAVELRQSQVLKEHFMSRKRPSEGGAIWRREEEVQAALSALAEGRQEQFDQNWGEEAYSSLLREAQNRMSRLAQAVSRAEKLRPKKAPMFHVRRQMSVEDFLGQARQQAAIWAQLEAFEAGQKKLLDYSAEKGQLRGRKKQLELRSGLRLPASLRSRGGSFAYHICSLTLPKDGLKAILDDLNQELEAAYAVELLQQTERQAVLLFAAESCALQALQLRLQQLGAQGLPQLEAGESRDFAQAAAALEEQIQALDQAYAAQQADLLDQAEQQEAWEVLHDYYSIAAEKLKALLQMVRTGNLLLLTAYVPDQLAERICRALEAEFACSSFLRPVTAEEKAPVLLENPKILKSYEAIVEMFSMPLVGTDPDPTPVMGPFYAFFFGMMLSDVGYGLLLAGIMAYLLFRVRVEGNMRRMCTVLMHGGLSAVVFGFLFGGFFGNALTQVSGERLKFPILWFDPMSEPMQMMAVSIVFGAIHLFVGMGVDIWMHGRMGKLYEGIVKNVPWYLIIGGVGLLFAGQSWAKYLIIAGAAAIVLLSAVGERNPLKRVFSGLGTLYGITSYLSDLLSYTRILALTLATAVIAMVVNILATLGGSSILGIILFLLIMPFGHLVNLALSGLSAYVHSMRLQYVEFFSKFYTGGGGTPFAPLRQKTRYVRLAAK